MGQAFFAAIELALKCQSVTMKLKYGQRIGLLILDQRDNYSGFISKINAIMLDSGDQILNNLKLLPDTGLIKKNS